METIAAISTAMGSGGIGIIRMTGKDCFKVLKKIFKPKNKELKEISKDTEQQKALNEVVHSIKKYSLEYRSRHVTDMKELQTLMEEKRKLQTLQISF